MGGILFLFRRLDCNDGVAAFAETLLTGLRANGERIVIASGPVAFGERTAPRHDAIRAGAVAWHVLPQIGAKTAFPASLARLRAIVRQHRPGVICAQGFSMLPLGAALSWLTGVPLAANYLPAASSHVGKPGSLAEKLAYRLATGIFAPRVFIAMSQDTASFFRETCGVAPARIASITLGVDTDFFRPPSPAERQQARRRLDIPPAALTCVQSGRVCADKGQHLSIAAVRQAAAHHPALICLIAGTNNGAEDIIAAAHADDRGRDMFRFLGFVDRALQRQIYWAADISLLPSRIEGFGLVIAESMACGCVPIRTPSGGAHDQIIEGQTGYLVPFDDVDALSARILDLADERRRACMSRHAIGHAQAHFRQQDMVAKTAALFGSLK